MGRSLVYYECTICNKKFKKIHNLYKHLLNDHKITKDEALKIYDSVKSNYSPKYIEYLEKIGYYIIDLKYMSESELEKLYNKELTKAVKEIEEERKFK
jgi:hypothetical protein